MCESAGLEWSVAVVTGAAWILLSSRFGGGDGVGGGQVFKGVA